MSKSNIQNELESIHSQFTSHLLVCATVLAYFLLSATVVADNKVKVYNKAPSAEEMGSILFSEEKKIEKQTAVRTRSISFSKKKTAPKMQEVQTKSVAQDPCSSNEEVAANSSEDKTRAISFSKKKTQAKMQDVSSKSVESAPCASNSVKSIGLPIKFTRNSSTIMDESLPFLKELGKMLAMDKYKNNNLLIEGHTDASGSDEYNLNLSFRRADSVKNYFIKTLINKPIKPTIIIGTVFAIPSFR